MIRQGNLITLAVLSLVIAVVGSQSKKQAQADFERCAGLMDRAQRTLRTYEQGVDRLKKLAGRLIPENSVQEKDGIEALESRVDYFRNRMERAAGLADKIRDDLKNVSGPTCPSCIVSSVNLYCRSAESLQEDIDEYLRKLSDLETMLGRHAAENYSDNKGAAYLQEKRNLDSVVAAVRKTGDTCNNRAGRTLWNQALINIARADSLYAAGNSAEARHSLSIGRVLLEKSAVKCTDR
jgi:hypothetical protein